MIPPDWRKVAYAALAAFVAGIVVQSCWPKPEPPPQRQWRTEVEQELAQARRKDEVIRRLAAQAEAAVAGADSVTKVAQRHERRAAVAQGQVAALKAQLAEGDNTPDSVAILVTIVSHQDTIIAQQDTVIQGQREAIARLGEAATLYKVRGDSLQSDLANARQLLRQGLTVIPKPCRVLWFPCPSRTATFVVGAVAGAAVSVAVLR